MRRNLALILMLLMALAPACGGTAGSELAEPVRAVIIFVTPSPTAHPTATPEATSTNVPVATATPLVLSETTDLPATPPPLTATPEPTPTATSEPDWLNTVGRTEDNLVYLGNPDAAVTLIDYSDFL